MKTIQVRLSDEEEAALRERMTLTGLSISGLVRACLFAETDAKTAQLPASAGQVNELTKQIAALSETVGRLAAGRETEGAAQKETGAVAREESGAAADKTERESAVPGADFAEFARLFQEQKSRPFGLDLPFVQATLMAVFTLARGSFSHCPEEWEPFKEEAWRRAFAGEDKPPCLPES